MVINMKKLYSLAINGYTKYFLGDIPIELYNKIDQIAKSIKIIDNDFEYLDYSFQFQKIVLEKYCIKLTEIHISYVFRKI